MAVIVTFPGDEGAVKAPLELIAPALTAHVTAESELPVPPTIALQCEPAPGATVAGAHEIATDETCDETGCGARDLAPPQPAHKSIAAVATMSSAAEQPEDSALDHMRYQSKGNNGCKGGCASSRGRCHANGDLDAFRKRNISRTAENPLLFNSKVTACSRATSSANENRYLCYPSSSARQVFLRRFRFGSRPRPASSVSVTLPFAGCGHFELILPVGYKAAHEFHKLIAVEQLRVPGSGVHAVRRG